MNLFHSALEFLNLIGQMLLTIFFYHSSDSSDGTHFDMSSHDKALNNEAFKQSISAFNTQTKNCPIKVINLFDQQKLQ